MEIKTRWEVDGKYFTSEEKAIEYVKKVEEKRTLKERLAKEKDDRWVEVDNAYRKFLELREKFCEDYGHYPAISYSISNLMRFFNG